MYGRDELEVRGNSKNPLHHRVPGEIVADRNYTRADVEFDNQPGQIALIAQHGQPQCAGTGLCERINDARN